jgi:hypothetical protein
MLSAQDKAALSKGGAASAASVSRGLVESRAAPLSGTDWGEDDDPVTARVLSLPKLVLVLEAWHVITLRRDLVRFMFARFDSARDNTKVTCSSSVACSCAWLAPTDFVSLFIRCSSLSAC